MQLPVSLLQLPPAHWTMNRQYRFLLVNKQVKREAVTLTKEKVEVKQKGLTKKAGYIYLSTM